MKQRKITWASGFILACMLIGSSFLFSSYQAKKMTDDLWKTLGISKQNGTEGIKNSFLNGYLYYYGVKNAKNIAVNDRAAIASDLLNYTREYVSGDVFKKQYGDMRKNAKPQEPVQKPLRSIAEIQKEEIAKTEKGIKDTEKTIKEVNADMAKGIQPVLDMLRKNLKDYQNPNHEYFAAIAMGEKYQQEGEQKRYADNMKRWETEYPESINAFIADKLEKMLEYTKGIDYNAVLVEKYGKKRFVNQAYEGKRTEWKQGFRAGKAVTESARAFAEKWLTELN
jgi:predicted phage tail protein